MIKIKEKYDINKKDDSNKIICNQLFTREAVLNKGPALILDAEDLRTTMWLNRREIMDITVPNPYVYDKIKRDRRIKPINKLVGEFLSNTFSRFTSVWLDYCCTFDGSESTGIRPKEDIQKLFNRKLLRNNSVLAVTFCYRKGTKVAYPDEDFGKAIACVTQEARKHGYNAVYLRHHKYKGMFFQMFRIYN